MPLENSSTIEGLDASWPLGGDPTNKGDDHLRLLKDVLKKQFPGVDGNGFKEPIVATEDEINFLSGVTSNIAQSISELENDADNAKVNLYAPQGTRLAFFNPGVPAGWTQLTTHNDVMLRIVNTAGGGTGGVDDPFDKSFNHKHTTQGHVLGVAEMPDHNHVSGTGRDAGFYGVASPGGSVNRATGSSLETKSPITSSSGGGSSHTHGDTGTTSLSFKPKYLNLIIGTKG